MEKCIFIGLFSGCISQITLEKLVSICLNSNRNLNFVWSALMSQQNMMSTFTEVSSYCVGFGLLSFFGGLGFMPLVISGVSLYFILKTYNSIQK